MTKRSAVSEVFNLLDNTILLEKKYLADDFSQVSESEMQRHLDSYRAARLALKVGARKESEEIAVFADVGQVGDNLLAQCALYVDRFYTLDPVFLATEPPSPLDLSIGVSPNIPRKHIARNLRYAQKVRPLVEAGYLHHILWEDAGLPRNVPILQSETNYFDVLPEDVLQKFRTLATVRSKVVTEDNRHLLMTNPMRSRHLGVSFRGGEGLGFGFDYQREIDPNNPEEWTFYTDNAINRAAWMFASMIDESTRLAASLNATMLTPHSLAAEVFGPPTPTSMADLSLPSLVDINLPTLSGVSAEALMEIRTKDGGAFLNFRRALQRRLVDYGKILDPSMRVQENIQIVDELRGQLREIDSKVKALKLEIGLQAAIAFATLAATPLGPLAAPIAAALLVGRAYAGERMLRGNPYFFLWKVNRATRSARSRT